MKNLKIIIALFLFPSISFSQSIVEKVRLKNGKYAILYSDKTWVFSDSTALPFNTLTTNPTITTPQVKSYSSGSSSTPYRATSSMCGALTKKGGSCKRMVAGGGRCYQHK